MRDMLFFFKKARAKKSLNLVRFSRRDLSYEIDSGPKTKTVKVTFSRGFPGDADGGGDARTTVQSGKSPSP